MDIQKRNRIVAATTVCVVLLLVILVAIMIYQIAVIGSLNKRKQQLEEEIDEVVSETIDAENKLEYYQTRDGVYKLYLELKSKQ